MTTNTFYRLNSQLLLTCDPKVEAVELNKSDDGKQIPIHAVAWSPLDDVFVLVRGFQPSMVTLWKYDRITARANQLKVLSEKAHRNTVKWNQFGIFSYWGAFRVCESTALGP